MDMERLNEERASTIAKIESLLASNNGAIDKYDAIKLIYHETDETEKSEQLSHNIKLSNVYKYAEGGYDGHTFLMVNIPYHGDYIISKNATVEDIVCAFGRRCVMDAPNRTRKSMVREPGDAS